MIEFKLREDEDYIKLGQLLKASNLVSSGAEAKTVITEGYVLLNGAECDMRGKKIYKGDIVLYKEKEIKVI